MDLDSFSKMEASTPEPSPLRLGETWNVEVGRTGGPDAPVPHGKAENPPEAHGERVAKASSLLSLLLHSEVPKEMQGTQKMASVIQ